MSIERLDFLFGLLVLVAIAIKPFPIPGSAILVMAAIVAALVWFGVRLVRVVNGPIRGLPKMFSMLVLLGISFNLFAILFRVMFWPGAGNVTAIGLLTVIGYFFWLRLPESPATQAPNRTLAALYPGTFILLVGLLVMPDETRFRTFHTGSRYMSYTEFTSGHIVREGDVVDSAGTIVRKAEPIK